MTPTREGLEAMRAFIEAADLERDDVYSAAVRSVIRGLAIEPGTLGDAMSCSVPTVRRWMNGVTVPHPGMRESLRRYALRRYARLTGKNWRVLRIRAEGTEQDDDCERFRGTREECDEYVKQHPLIGADAFHRSWAVEEIRDNE